MGSWLIQPALNRIQPISETATDKGEAITIGSRLMAVLVRLAEQPGTVVTRDVLFDTVWPNVVVNEDALTRAVSELRKILGDDPQHPRYIETIRNRGYLLVAPVTAIVEEVTSDTEHTSRSRRGRSAGQATWVRLTLLLTASLLILSLALWRTRPSAPPTPTLLRATPFTSFSGRETDATLSPDGSKVAFAWSGLGGDNFDIYIKQRNTETPLRLSNDPGLDFHPAWSPDGNTLAFVRTEANENGRPLDEYGIYTVPAIGGPSQRITSTQYWSRGLDWSPDGTQLVYADQIGPDKVYRLFLLDLASRERVALTTSPAQHSDHSAMFSPDGTTIAFIRSDPSGLLEQLFIIPTSGGEPHPVTPEQINIAGMDWMPDGEHLVFAGDRVGLSGLWRIALETGHITWMPIPGEWISFPSIARKADRLIYERAWSQTNIWRLRLSEPSAEPIPEPLIGSTRLDAEARYSPDGARIVFTSTRTGYPEIWMANADGSETVQMTNFSGGFVHGPRWSPDGRHIVFYANPEGRTTLYLLDLDGSPPRQLSEGRWNDRLPTWSRNGQWIYFTSDRSGTWQIWKRSLTNSDVQQVTTSGGLMAHEGTNGALLYITKANQSGLWQVMPDEDEERLVIESIDPDYLDTWTIADNGLFFVEATPEGSRLAFFDFTTHAIQAIARLTTIDLASRSLAVSPDGQTILYAIIEQWESDLMLVDNVH